MFREKIIEFVVKKNREGNLNLSNFQIDALADAYESYIEGEKAKGIDPKTRFLTDEVFDKVFNKFKVTPYIDDSSKESKAWREGVSGAIDTSQFVREARANDNLGARVGAEREINARAGYGYIESYDDLGLDEATEEDFAPRGR